MAGERMGDSSGAKVDRFKFLMKVPGYAKGRKGVTPAWR